MGYPIIDPILSIIISLVILYTGISILLDNIKVLLDSNVLDNDEIEECILCVDGIKGVENIRSRGTKSNIFIDMHLILDEDMTVKQAQEIKNTCKNDLINKFPEIKDILIEIDC